mgnify:CR=1 FL=1
MEYSENLHTRCNIEEAVRISDHLTFDVSMLAVDCYTDAFYSVKGETFWKQRKGLDAVYMLGFISGCRAIRERQKVKRQA